MSDSANGEFPTTIGADAVFKGELSFEKSVRILGRFEGTIDTKGQLVVAQGATLQGEVRAGEIRVDGKIKGNLSATGKVQLNSSANLEGDLHVSRLEVADGAVFVGRCVVGAPNATAAKSASGAPAQTAGGHPGQKPTNQPTHKEAGVPQPAMSR